ncbi:hypothetical protein [Hymenobacter sp. B81]|uniref:hypothetical protein n=1 Tax=Hymenobacter sp. B81 TaxID=3344878 RepID=UPI0037DD6F75
MFTFERTESFEIILTDLYEAIFVPLSDLERLNPSLSIHTELLTGPGFQASAKTLDVQPVKSSIELEIFRSDKQILAYSLSYSDAYSNAEGQAIDAAFCRSIQTQFFDTAEQAKAAAVAALQNLDFDAPLTPEDERAWDSLRDFPLDDQQLREAIREDLHQLLQTVV